MPRPIWFQWCVIMDKQHAFFEEHAACWDGSMHASNKSHRRIRQFVRRCAIDRGMTVLDVATGTGILIPYLLERVGEAMAITALDYAGGMLAAARQKAAAGVRFVQGDACHLPFCDAMFDRVICFSAFPHFADQSAAAREFFRVTVPGGRVIIAHLMGSAQLNAMHQQVDPAVRAARMPDADSLRTIFERCGFQTRVLEDTEDRFFAEFCRIDKA